MTDDGSAIFGGVVSSSIFAGGTGSFSHEMSVGKVDRKVQITEGRSVNYVTGSGDEIVWRVGTRNLTSVERTFAISYEAGIDGTLDIGFGITQVRFFGTVDCNAVPTGRMILPVGSNKWAPIHTVLPN